MGCPEMPDRPSIAILGTRGIPANYGGFETFAEELSSRLAARGYPVTVYCRTANADYKRFASKTYKGVRLVVLPTIRHKYLDTVVHAFLSSVHVLFHRFDVILYCNAANSLFMILPRLAGTRVAINVDGIERKRKKWNSFGRLWYRMGEWLAPKLAHEIIADAQVIHDYYKERYGVNSRVIAYGAHVHRLPPGETLRRFGLEPKGYVLYVSRLEPENNAHRVIAAFDKVRSGKKLLIVGSAPYSDKYIEELRSTKDPRVIFAGGVYKEGYHELQANAYCYVQATEVGGTHPALIEAMAAGNCVIANGTPENLEVVADSGLIYPMNDVDELGALLQRVLDDPVLAKSLGEKASARAASVYSWETVTDQYEGLFQDLAKRHS